jgi:hypothetical protein
MAFYKSSKLIKKPLRLENHRILHELQTASILADRSINRFRQDEIGESHQKSFSSSSIITTSQLFRFDLIYDIGKPKLTKVQFISIRTPCVFCNRISTKPIGIDLEKQRNSNHLQIFLIRNY